MQMMPDNLVELTISKWEIRYKNATQVKNLIKHEDYLNIIKPLQENIRITQYLADKETNTMEKSLLEASVKMQNAVLDKYTGGEYWFTTKSPLYLSFNTGILKLNYGQTEFNTKQII